MLNPLQHIADLSEICFRAGVSYVVISPGSRNAPLIDAFTRCFKENCISIVDERSAGYFALGLAKDQQKPVVLLCTSGTAVLNYGPALAEAYYQCIPLIAITADRPAEWIDQQDNQTIRQSDIYRNFVKKSIVLPEMLRDNLRLKEVHNSIQEILQLCLSGSLGPVHINVPLREPLYGEIPPSSAKIADAESKSVVSELVLPDEFIEQWDAAKKIMIIHGQDLPGSIPSENLEKLLGDKRLVFVAENLSNLRNDSVITHPELLLAHTGSEKLISPDLLIYSGGQLVSKRLKLYLRSINIHNSWRIGIDKFEMDTFRQNNDFISVPIQTIYEQLGKRIQNGEPNPYRGRWFEAKQASLQFLEKNFPSIPFSDLFAVNKLLDELPQESIVENGNSSPVRYSQLARFRTDLIYNSNRGVSGIDGCMSTAAGTAYSSGKLTYTIVGDLSFVYDSNALWNRELPANLKIVVLNNSGGGIFGLIDGPGKKKAFEDFFIAHHPVNLQKLAEAFNLNYFCVKDEEELTAVLPVFSRKMDRAAVLEVVTERKNNVAAFNKVMGR